MRVSCLAALIVTCSMPVWGQVVIFTDGFESGDTSGWWAPARVSETGQVTCFDESGTVIPCAGTGQDGDLLPGVPWPAPRFVDNGNGTVTDMLTGLVWLKNANCFGHRSWIQALDDANTLASGSCGLDDGSLAGEWRLPSVKELASLIDFEYFDVALSNAAGTGQWTEGDPFSGVQSDVYWSSSNYAAQPSKGWYVDLFDGWVINYDKAAPLLLVWPVRGPR